MKSFVLDIFIGHKSAVGAVTQCFRHLKCNFKSLLSLIFQSSLVLSLPSTCIYYGEKIKNFSKESTLDFEAAGENILLQCLSDGAAKQHLRKVFMFAKTK